MRAVRPTRTRMDKRSIIDASMHTWLGFYKTDADCSKIENESKILLRFGMHCVASCGFVSTQKSRGFLMRLHLISCLAISRGHKEGLPYIPCYQELKKAIGLL